MTCFYLPETIVPFKQTTQEKFTVLLTWKRASLSLFVTPENAISNLFALLSECKVPVQTHSSNLGVLQVFRNQYLILSSYNRLDHKFIIKIGNYRMTDFLTGLRISKWSLLAQT